MTKRLVLSGGGDFADSIEHHRLFASWLSPKNRLLYIPGGGGSATDGYKWITSAFANFGTFSIEMCDILSGDKPPSRENYDGIYIGGGNTFTLLDAFRRSSFDKQLHALALSGCPIFGGSAGAILLGKDLGTCAHMDPNDVGLKDLSGLDLINGFAIWCHFEPSLTAMVNDFVESRKIPVIALPENAGVVCEGEELRGIGPGEMLRFKG